MARTLNETIHLVIGLAQAVGSVPDLDGLYEATGFGAQLAYDLYPHIDCHTGCNRCCRDNSLPIVSPLEWERLYRSVTAMPEATKQAWIDKALDWQNRLGPTLWELHELLAPPATIDKFERIADLLGKFQGTSCPFLLNDRCSVYEDRPAKCRAHGAYLIRIGDLVQLHSCAEEVDKMEAHLERQGSRKIAMPFWNPVEERLHQLNAPDAVNTVLPLWILAHVEDGQFLDAPVLAPDWTAVRTRWMGRF